MEDAALNSHLAAQDRAEEMDGMSYQELLDAYEDASENNAWATMDDLRRQIDELKSLVHKALRETFVDAASAVDGLIPQVKAGEIVITNVSDWIRECCDTQQYSEMMIDMVLGKCLRDSIIDQMAREYAESEAEGLLMADWSAE